MSPLGLTWAQAAGGIVSSLADMTTWDRDLYQGRLLPARQQHQLESLVSQATGKPILRTTLSDPLGYGLGVAQGASGQTGNFWYYEGQAFGVLAAFLWVLGMGARFAFAIWATHSGAAAIGRFSVRHDITGANIWQVALVLMAFGEVMSRTGVLQFRRTRALNCRNSLGADPDGAGNSRPAYQAA